MDTSNASAVARDLSPVTRSRLLADLLGLGVRPGGVLIVHARLSAVGWVPGGADTVVQALLDALGPYGTLMVLCGWEHHCYDLERWPIERREAYLAEPPAFDPRHSAANREMGRLAERVRTWPGAHRSRHPLGSFAALGRRSEQLLDDQPWDGMYGPGSPLAGLVEADGQVLLLGAPLETVTLLHYCEAVAVVAEPPDGPGKRWVRYRMPLRADADPSHGVEWRQFTELETGSDEDPGAEVLPYAEVVGHDVDPFEVIMTDALAAGVGHSGRVGHAASHALPARALSVFGARWIESRFGGVRARGGAAAHPVASDGGGGGGRAPGARW
jgi:aminoglycoside 3-N-acetyltransferase